MSLSSDSGQVQVAWQADGPAVLTMTPRDGRPIRLLYKGEGERLFVSGLADGDYELRLAGADGALSDPVVISVRHQSRARALWLFALGAFATLGIVVVILRGARGGGDAHG